MEPIEIHPESRRRLIDASPSEVFAALSDTARCGQIVGPTGFTDMIERFAFKLDGAWLLTMHGPDGKDDPNEIDRRDAEVQSRRATES